MERNGNENTQRNSAAAAAENLEPAGGGGVRRGGTERADRVVRAERLEGRQEAGRPGAGQGVQVPD